MIGNGIENLERELRHCQGYLGSASAKIAALEAELDALNQIVEELIPQEYLTYGVIEVPVKSQFYPHDTVKVYVKQVNSQ